MFRNVLKASAFIVTCASGPLSAASILTDTSTGLVDGILNSFAAGNSGFLAQIEGDHDITYTADFADMSLFSGHDAVWVNAHIGSGPSTFTAQEAANVRDFVRSGKRAAIITDNAAWSSFNAQIETIIDATITDTCDVSVGTGNAGHILGQGVTAVDHACGSVLDPADHATVIVDQGIASLYSIGLGEALVITSVDQFMGASVAQPQLLENISDWFDTPLASLSPAPRLSFASFAARGTFSGLQNTPAPVPVPAGLPLVLSGFAALALLRRASRRG